MTTRTKVILALVVLAIGWFAYQNFTKPPLANVPPPPGPIVAFGDSITEGVGAAPGQSYPDHLAGMLERPVINRGVGGDTAASAMPRLERDVLAEDPAVVLLCLGGNDILRRNEVGPVFETLDRMIGRIIESGAMVVLIGIEGLPLLTEDFGARYAELAREHGCVYVPDILDGIITRPELMADQIHPNGEGYRIMAERIHDALVPYLPEEPEA